MAGIGFSLRRLFDKKGILNLCKAYGYAGIITTGPMLMGVLLLLGIAFLSRMGGMDVHNRELLNCMLTYTLLVSLTITSWFNMAVTRYTADMLYQGREEKVMPSFHGACRIMVTIGAVVYGIFLFFSGATLLQGVLCLCFLMILVVA
ncbi:MAG: exopolysaccharide Pel transporter PelG, partial [Muricoprocola sp.]